MNCQAWANLGASYPIVDDRGSTFWSDFGNGAIPRNTIIDMDGVVHYNSTGFNEAAITGILDELLSTTGTAGPTEVPDNHVLLSVFPNPFNAQARIQFNLSVSEWVEIAVFDGQGKPVRHLLAAHLSAGSHTLAWNARDDVGTELPSGVYIAKLAHQAGQETSKILLLK